MSSKYIFGRISERVFFRTLVKSVLYEAGLRTHGPTYVERFAKRFLPGKKENVGGKKNSKHRWPTKPRARRVRTLVYVYINITPTHVDTTYREYERPEDDIACRAETTSRTHAPTGRPTYWLPCFRRIPASHTFLVIPVYDDGGARRDDVTCCTGSEEIR